MNKMMSYWVIGLIAVGMLFNVGCKKSEQLAAANEPAQNLTVSEEEGTDQFTLTVITEEGVVGSPLSGTFARQTKDAFEYDFELEEGYARLQVRLDGEDVAPRGTTKRGKSTIPKPTLTFRDFVHQVPKKAIKKTVKK